MKNMLLLGGLFLFLIGVLIFVARAGENKPADVIKITTADNGKTIKIPVEKKFEIHLKGNPTTGYEWQIAEIKGEAVKSDGQVSYIPQKNDPPRIGSGGTFVFPLATVKTGKATINMHYLRKWEKDKPPADKFSVEVEVTEK
jgi:inhibitor of cysteine peptidase